MSYRAWACNAYVMSWDNIKKLVPDEAQEYEKIMLATFDDEEEAALTLGKDTLPEGFENWKTALDNLYEAFLRYTGLTLQLGYISESDSDADEVGVMWFVSGVETFTPAGEKFKDLFKFYQWVEYG